MWKNEPVPCRPATLKDPGTPDQIVLDQHSLTVSRVSIGAKCASNPKSPLSTSRTVELRRSGNFSLTADYGYIEDGGTLIRLRDCSWEPTHILEPYTRQWCQTPKIWTCRGWLLEQQSASVTWCMNTLVYTETRKEFFS